jgi:hypothetical protein
LKIDSCCENDTPDGTSSSSISSEGQAKLVQIHQEPLSIAVAAGEIGISQKECIILTKQAFLLQSTL